MHIFSLYYLSSLPPSQSRSFILFDISYFLLPLITRKMTMNGSSWLFFAMVVSWSVVARCGGCKGNQCSPNVTVINNVECPASGVSIVRVPVSTQQELAIATCPSGSQLTGGGCRIDCDVPPRRIEDRPDDTLAPLESWRCSTDIDEQCEYTATAFCLVQT